MSDIIRTMITNRKPRKATGLTFRQIFKQKGVVNNMSVNGINQVMVQDPYAAYPKTAEKKATEKAAEKNTPKASETAQAVVYEKSASDSNPVKKAYTQNTDLIAKMQADAEAKTAQLRSLVEQMIQKQGNKYGEANDIWSFLASGDFTVDPATKAQAQEDISEDGYWGVKETSQRIYDFAMALSGGDPDTMEDMRAAFEKGFEEATKTWGKELPSITKDTYDAVMKKFDDYKAQQSSTPDTI